MKRVTLLVRRRTVGRFVGWLQRQGLVHLEDAHARTGEGNGFKRLTSATEDVDARLRELETVLGVFDTFAPLKRGFVQSFVPMPMRISAAEMEGVVAEFDLGPLHGECVCIGEEHREHERAIAAAEAELEALEFFRQLPFELQQVRSLKRVQVWIGSLDLRSWANLQLDTGAAELMALQELFPLKRGVHVCAIALERDRDEAGRLLRRYGFSERAVPELEGDLAGGIGALRAELSERRDAVEALRARAVELSACRREVDILRGHYQACRARLQAFSSMAATKRIAMVCGYVRVADVDRFGAALTSDFPDVPPFYADPVPDDSVPVSITNGRLVKPMRFLIDMFGRPDYFSFDPTPFLSVGFLVFFGMCFGDVLYGLLLCGVAWYLSKKSEGYEGLHNFTMMFFYCGISTIVFGVLTGSWASDLWRPEYIGEGNPLLWIKERTALVDPLEKAVAMLLVSLGLGVVNQFWGIVMKGYGLIRRGDIVGAVLDAGLWLVALPGFLITVSPLFFPTPTGLYHIGLALFAVGGGGLVLTQGRKEKGLVAKAATGVVSLYGIVGTYGCVSFVGDMLSYSRLLALGLTTGIVGMSFNIIGGLFRSAPPWIGIPLFIVVVVGGHLFNFTVSILGAFVHPARLIFMEFFNRFYESGGVRFSPLSLDTELVLVESGAERH